MWGNAVAKKAKFTILHQERVGGCSSPSPRESRVQHRHVEARLLQCSVVWRTGGNIWQAPACPEQPGQSRLPEPGSHRRQAAALVTSLAPSETAGHLQSGSADPQGAVHSHSGVSQWPDTDPCTDSDFALIGRSTAGRPTNTYRTGATRFLCRSPIHLQLFTCWHSTVRERSLI